MLCNLLCQPYKLLGYGCLTTPEYHVTCAYIPQWSLPLWCATFFPPPIFSPTIVVNSSYPSFSGSLWSTFSGSLCPPSAGHCDLPSTGHCDLPSASHCDLTSAGHCDLTSAGHCDLPSAGHCSLPLAFTVMNSSSICLHQKGVNWF